MSLASYTHLPKSLNDLFFGDYVNDWIMQHEERLALVFLLSKIRPVCAIEIGTANGGSLSVISRFSQKVYTLDVDPTCSQRLGGQFPNVEFITGKSQNTLKPLLQHLKEAGARLEFVLIDGDHTGNGVRQDIEHLLSFQPTRPLFVVMHDSFMPAVRRGILEASWETNLYVHFVEVDFLSGRIEPDNKMTCGFALAIMLPYQRTGKVLTHTDRELLYRKVLKGATNRPRLMKRLVASVKRRLPLILPTPD